MRRNGPGGLGFKSVLALAALTLISTACSEVRFLTQAAKTAGGPPPAPAEIATAELGAYKVGNPYQIDGTWYYPQTDFQYDETGVASWYGPQFHGKATANGAVFDMNRVTAAHRTLPLPSYVRVTNLDNGRSLEVLVNDRGPFAKNRIIDLSRRSAQLLGFENKGTALVRVEVLADRSRRAQAVAQGLEPDSGTGTGVAEALPDSAPVVSVASISAPSGTSSGTASPSGSIQRPIPANPTEAEIVAEANAGEPKVEMRPVVGTPSIFVQAGAFSRYDNAQRSKALLQSVGPVELSQVQTSASPLFRVRVGPVASVQDADALLAAISNAGFPDARIVVID